MLFISRHYRYELKLACLLWKIDLRSVTLMEANSNDNFVGQQFKVRRLAGTVLQ